MINKVINICKEYEEELLWDTESNRHYYYICYNKEKIQINIIEIYHIEGENDIMIGKNKTIIEEFKCTMKEYLQVVISFHKDEIIKKYNGILKKIIIRGE